MPCGISKGIQTLPVRSMPRSTGRYMPKLTWLQLTLARSTTSHPFGWRLLLRQQLLQAPITILFALTSHKREMYMHTRECGLYELQVKALKVTRKTKWCLNTGILNYRYSSSLCWPLATSCFYDIVLPLHSFLILIFWPILPLAYHCSAQSCPTCLHPTLTESGSCPPDHRLPTKTNQASLTNGFYSQPNTEARVI